MISKSSLKEDINLEEIRSILDTTYHGNRALLENKLRKSFLEKINEHPDTSDIVLNYIRVVLEAVDLGLCTTSTPFLLLQDSLDVMSRDRCDEIFLFIEKNLNLWKKEPLNNAGKNYLLRMCNGLLKRLSPSQDTLLCGRIQIFLAQLFPISERSGLNLNGQFNLDNMTMYEDQQEFIQFKENRTNFLKTHDDSELVSEEQIKIDSKIESYEFYQKFWSVQDFFRDPSQCFEPIKWIKFVDDTNEVMDVFLLVQESERGSNPRRADPNSDRGVTAPGSDHAYNSITTHYWSSPTKRVLIPTDPSLTMVDSFQASIQRPSKKRRRRTVSTEERGLEEVINSASQAQEDLVMGDDGLETSFFAKYLTGSNLLHMQVCDVHFRRCILLQYLFTFQYLLTDSKFKTVQQVLDENQKAWITTTQQIIYDLLGTKMRDSVDKILTYESVWNDWKNSGCPNFTKMPPPSPLPSPSPTPPTSTSFTVETTALKVKTKNGYAKKIHMDLGNPELTALWNYEPDNAKACSSKDRIFHPSLDQFLSRYKKNSPPEARTQDKSLKAPIANGPQESSAPGDANAIVADDTDGADDADQNDRTFEWKTLRLLSRESKHFFWSYFSNASTNPSPVGAANKNGRTEIITDFIATVADKIRGDEQKRQNALLNGVGHETVTSSARSRETGGESRNSGGAEKGQEDPSPPSPTSLKGDLEMGTEAIGDAKDDPDVHAEDTLESSRAEPENSSVDHEDKSYEEGELETTEAESPTGKKEKTPRGSKAKVSPKKDGSSSLRSRSKRIKAKHDSMKVDATDEQMEPAD